MTLPERIERVQAALNEIANADAYWREGEMEPGLSSEDRAHRKTAKLAREAEFGWQANNVKIILTAHEATRGLVEEACDELDAVEPWLVTMGNWPSRGRIRKAHELLRAALQGEH